VGGDDQVAVVAPGEAFGLAFAPAADTKEFKSSLT